MNAAPAFATAAAIRSDLAKRRYSAVEAARAALDRLAGLGTSLRAVAEITADRAVREARAADRRLRRGEGGPLCGVPYGAKDLLAVAGVPTRWGTPFYRDQVFDEDATVIARLSRAGAVLVAKLAMVELAGGGGYRDPAASITGATQNPWDRSFWSGGSSSGSGAAVAAGIVPFALGSETTGSVVIPASFCGVTGVRPSFGLVSRHGVMPLSWSLDKIGPLAHTARDCEEVIRAISGLDALDPATVAVRYRPTSRSTFRLGILPFDEDRYPEVRRAFAAALRALRGIGMPAVKIDFPKHDYRKIAASILAAESVSAHAELIAGPGLAQLIDDAQRRNLARNATLPARDYVVALQERARAVRDVRALFATVDAFVAPTVLTEATRIATDLDEWRPHYHYGSMAAVTGLPGVSVPMGFGAAGLPLGITFITDQYQDAAALRIASLFQRATDWHDRHPTLDG